MNVDFYSQYSDKEKKRKNKSLSFSVNHYYCGPRR